MTWPWSLFIRPKHLSQWSDARKRWKNENQMRRNKKLMFDRYSFEMWMWQVENWMECVFRLFCSAWIQAIHYGLAQALIGSINFWFQSCNNWFITIETRWNWARCSFALSLGVCVLLRTRQLYNCTNHSVGHARIHNTHYKRCRGRERERETMWSDWAKWCPIQKLFRIFQWVID